MKYGRIMRGHTGYAVLRGKGPESDAMKKMH
jgi:hypothetical protein